MEENNWSSREKGDSAEDVAVHFLVQRGYRIRERQWRSGRYEIDIIAENASHIVFVEVKSRSTSQYGAPWEAVSREKQKKIALGAHAYLKKYDGLLEPRFDIISILAQGRPDDIQHIEDAFYPFNT